MQKGGCLRRFHKFLSGEKLRTDNRYIGNIKKQPSWCVKKSKHCRTEPKKERKRKTLTRQGLQTKMCIPRQSLNWHRILTKTKTTMIKKLQKSSSLDLSIDEIQKIAKWILSRMKLMKSEVRQSRFRGHGFPWMVHAWFRGSFLDFEKVSESHAWSRRRSHDAMDGHGWKAMVPRMIMGFYHSHGHGWLSMIRK